MTSRTRITGGRHLAPAAGESLRAIIEDISGELLLRPLLTRIVRRACELIGADNGTIGLVDRARDLVRTEAAYRMPTDEMGAEMSRGVGLAGQVLAADGPVVLERYGEVSHPTQTSLLENAVVGVPIRWRGEMIGVFGIGTASGGPPFGDDDVEMLSLFARHAAVAISNARRYEWERRQAERFELIARVGRIVAADLEAEEAVPRAAEAIRELLGYPYVAIAVVEETNEPDTLLLWAEAGVPTTDTKVEIRPTRLPVSDGLLGAAARERRTIQVNDVTGDKRYVPTPGVSGICAELATPILLGDRLLGVLNVESDAPFAPEDAAGLAVVADQLAVALNNARLFSDTRRALSESQLLSEATARMSAAADVAEVITAYLEPVAAGGRFACSVTRYEWEAGNNEPSQVVVLGSWTPEGGLNLTERRHPYRRDSLDDLLDRGETVVIRDVYEDPRVPEILRQIQKESGRPALVLIPLRAQMPYRLGHVVLSAPDPHSWTDAEVRRYQITAAHLAAALECRLQQTVSAQRQQQLAVLEERHRLARDLHDAVKQTLFSLNLIAQTIPAALKRDPVEAERRVARLTELSQTALGEMHGLLNELGPSSRSAEVQDLTTALKAHLRQVRDNTAALARMQGTQPPRILFEGHGYSHSLSPEREAALFRITQEAVTNALKHADARQVRVCLRTSSQGTVRLTVNDDGVGMLPPTSLSSGRGHGMGLRNMRERAEVYGGTFSLSSQTGQGTRIEVRMPTRS